MHPGHAKKYSTIIRMMKDAWVIKCSILYKKMLTYAETKSTDFRKTHDEAKNVNAPVRGSSILRPASMTRS